MARESKRKRDERRFGKSERLADMVIATPPSRWLTIPNDRDVSEFIRKFQGEISIVPVIDATNVMEFYARHDKVEWDYAADTPCASPPFPEFWVEMRCPEVMVTSRGPERRGPHDAEMLGFLVSAWENDGSPIGWCLKSGGLGADKLLEGVYWVLRIQPITCIEGRPLWASYYKAVPVALDGRIVDIDMNIYSGLETTGLDLDQIRELFRELSQGLMPLLLTISFMNCKNVSISPVEPDREINRERKKAGLRPFVRYHTINIEPMKKVLRTEGNIEAEGLKRALHLCRGHFATYTDNFMGRPLDKPMTVWRPAHVRGSLDEGVVIGDYNVKAPVPEERPMPPTFATHKDDPLFAVRTLSLILVCGNHPANPNMTDVRLLKARHLLKTLALAAGVDEAEVDRAWVDASCPDDESPAETPTDDVAPERPAIFVTVPPDPITGDP
jgi:hypothetical protein